MDGEAVQSMLQQDREEWAALCAALDARPDGPLHDPESPEWTARDVYAHLARWINHSTDAFESWVTARALPPPTEGMQGKSDDEINARWQAEDRGLTLAAARERAQQAFDRRLRAIQSMPADRWDEIAEATAKADGHEHYRNHRRYIAQR
jgi:hypothetical protein